MADAPATNPIGLARQPFTESATRTYSRNYLNCPPYLGDGCLWPKADIRTESKSAFLNDRFGEKSGHSAPLAGLIRADFT